MVHIDPSRHVAPSCSCEPKQAGIQLLRCGAVPPPQSPVPTEAHNQFRFSPVAAEAPAATHRIHSSSTAASTGPPLHSVHSLAMETSLRYGNGEKQLVLHAKENFLLDKSFFLQVHGKLNTHTGAAHGTAQLKCKFFPELLTGLDIGARFDSQLKEFTYDIQGKKTLPVTDNGLLSVDLKGGYNYNPGSRKGKPRGVVELSYKVFNFTEDQDLKLKIGYNAFKQTPYFQIRENNWTLNHELNGGWNVIYDL